METYKKVCKFFIKKSGFQIYKKIQIFVIFIKSTKKLIYKITKNHRNKNTHIYNNKKQIPIPLQCKIIFIKTNKTKLKNYKKREEIIYTETEHTYVFKKQTLNG